MKRALFEGIGSKRISRRTEKRGKASVPSNAPGSFGLAVPDGARPRNSRRDAGLTGRSFLLSTFLSPSSRPKSHVGKDKDKP